MNKTICCIASHVDSDLKMDIILNNLLFLGPISDFVVIINSSELTPYNVSKKISSFNSLFLDSKTIDIESYKIKYCQDCITREDVIEYYFTIGKSKKEYFTNENEVIFSYEETDNNNLFDFYKFEVFDLNYKFIIERCFSNIILTNDSYILIKSLSDFRDLFLEEVELSTILVSHENKEHATSMLRRYNKTGYKKWNSNYQIQKPNLHCQLDLIQKIEVGDYNNYETINYLFNSSETTKNIHFEDNIFKGYIDRNYPLIKLKSLFRVIYDSLPKDFNPEVYKSLHRDLSKHANNSASFHFLNNGIKEKRIYTKDRKTFFPDDFDVEIYKYLNPDLIGMDNKTATEHFKNFGISERRMYQKEKKLYIPKFLSSFFSEGISKYNRKSIGEYSKAQLYEYFRGKFIKCGKNQLLQGSELNMNIKKKTYPIEQPYLFHKKILKMESKMTYNVISESERTKRNVCCIHCYKLSFLDKFFRSYLDIINSVFDIIVTFYIYDIDESELEKNITYIQGDNVGFDIGPRFITTKYLDGNYDYIFYMHSKTNDSKREQYITPFINNILEIKDKMDENKLGGIFHSILLYGKYPFNGNLKKCEMKNLWGRNECYMEEITDYLNLRKDYYLFSEGNFYIINKEVNELLFSDEKLYGCLNSLNSFDYNWVVNYYNVPNPSIRELYLKYIRNKWHGNNVNTGLGWKGLADCMIEHIFERLTILAVKSLNYIFEILDFSPISNEKIQTKSLEVYNDPILLIYDKDVEELDNIIFSNLEKFRKFIIIMTISNKNTSYVPSLELNCYNHSLSEKALDLYRKYHLDLLDLTNNELRNHYKNHGYKEGRFLGDIPVINSYFTETENSECKIKLIMDHFEQESDNIFLLE